jgi:hypothetical protein
MIIEDKPPGGAYGFTVAGLSDARALLVDAPPHWPRVELSVQRPREPTAPPERVDDATAVVHLSSGGWVTIDRQRRAAVFSMPLTPSPAALVHPHLAAVGVVEAHWQRRESFHAGAFVENGGVWGLLGVKGAGKSSMLASLAESGVPVLCDDLLVLSGLTALAGPRSIDLREAAAQRLGAGVELGRIGERERWRVALEPVPAELPFRGWVELRWGKRVSVCAKRGSERLRALLPHRGLRVTPARPEQLIGLAAMPMLELHRPAAWGSHEQAINTLLRSVTRLGDPRGLQQCE